MEYDYNQYKCEYKGADPIYRNDGQPWNVPFKPEPFQLRKHRPLDGYGDDAIIWWLKLPFSPEWFVKSEYRKGSTNEDNTIWYKDVKIPNGYEAEKYAKLFYASRDLFEAAQLALSQIDPEGNIVNKEKAVEAHIALSNAIRKANTGEAVQ